MVQELQNVDWTSIGVTVFGFVATIAGIVNWLKKNIANVQQLRSDGADISEQTKYFKAILKDNVSLKNEISNQKIQSAEMIKTLSKLINQKDAELAALKTDVKALIQTIKEANSNVIPK